MIDPSIAVSRSTAEAPVDVGASSNSPAKIKSPAALVQPPADRSLDQWRGLALVLVLISHALFETKLVPGVGRAGVNLFFFISGILVFRSLSRGPQDKWAGAKYFWIRRTKRLVPAKYFYLFCMTLLVLLAWNKEVTAQFRESFFKGLPSSFLYYRNYYPGSGLAVHENLAGHLWSLACEMQFYLLAPLIFFLGGKTIGRRLWVYGVVLALMLAGGVSVLGKTEFPPYAFQVAAWPMMAGFCAEFLRDTFPKQCARWGKLLVAAGVVSLAALVGATLLTQMDYAQRKKIVVLAGTPLVAGCLGCYLEGIAPRGFIGNALHYLGNRTYSIYLWQQPLTIGGLMPLAWQPLGSLLSIAVGALSFRFLEQPFMSKYKKRPAKL